MNRIDAITTLKELKSENKLYQYHPYGWQIEFHKSGKDNPERMLCAANRVGKTYSAAREVAYHITGLYPDWWGGKRLEAPVLIWCGGVTNESLRDIVQKELLGGLGSDLGTGAIPKKLIGAISKRQCGIGDVIDTAKIKHVSGRDCTIVFKSYEQGWKKWQGTAPQVIWLDEEPEDYKIYTECMTRILTSKGILLVTFTPLSGLTDMVQHFREGKPGTYVKNVTWDDVEHLGREEKERLLASLPEHERDARSKGIPMMGEGRIFPFDEKIYTCSPFEIPDHFHQIIGIDFGYDHPAATAKLVYDADSDIEYVVSAHKQTKMDALMHSDQVKRLGGGLYTGNIPVAWPHDGLNTEKGKGVQLIQNYRGHDINLLSMSARYKNDSGGAQSVEKCVMDIYERIQTGRFKIFSNLSPLLEEMRNYHRKDGKIVDRLDDIIAAVRYAKMMRRFAVPKYIRKQTYQGSYL